MTQPGKPSVGVRVRPNAHDFIRDLREQLRAKKYTFYVDVRARTGQATRDVIAWRDRDLKALKAHVSVGANTGQATRDVAEWRRRMAEQAATKVKIGADLSSAHREVEAWRKIAGRDLEIRVRANVDGRGTGVESLRRKVEREAKIPVSVDRKALGDSIKDAVDDASQTGLFDIKISKASKDKAKVEYSNFINSLGEQAELELGLDFTKAKVEADAFRKEQKANPIKAQVEMDRARLAKAKADLAEFRLSEARKKIKIRVDVDAQATKWNAFRAGLQDLEKTFGNASVIRSLDFGPLNLGKPTGLVGTISSLTLLAGLVPGAVTGIAALSDAFMRLAGAAAIVPGAIASIGASLGTLGAATYGVGPALTALFGMWNEGASKTNRINDQLVTSTNNYRNAVVDEKRAQEDVGRARRDALHELRDLNNELRGGVLNEAQAILDVQKARDEYARGAAKGFATATDEVQSRLNIAKAEQNLITTREDNIKLGERANEANAKGVEGSDRVTQAVEAQTRASQQLQQATNALREAQDGGKGAAAKYADALGQLSPNARDFVETIAGAKSEIMGLQQALQETVFQGLGPAMRGAITNLMPMIAQGTTMIAQGLNENLLQVFSTLQGPEGQSIISRILGGTAEAQRALTAVIDPLIRGVGTLAAAGAEHLPQVVDLIGRLAERFALFIEKADESGALDEFMNKGVQALSDIAEIGVNAIKIINDFSTAFNSAFGKDILSSIRDITTSWHEFLSSAEGQQKLNDYIMQAKEIWEDWKPVLQDLPDIFDSLSDAAARGLKVILALLNPITEALEHMPWLVELFASVWITGKIVGALGGMFKTTKALWAMGTAIKTITGWAGGLLTKLGLLPTSWAARLGGAPGAAGAPAAVGTGGALAAAGGAVQIAASGINAYSTARDRGQNIPSSIASAGTAGLSSFVLPGSGFLIPMLPNPLGNTDAPGVWKKAIDWINAGADENDKRRRAEWVKANVKPNDTSDDFTPPKSYMTGGYTGWPQEQGNLAVLHGREYVQPADTTAYYGVGIMQAIHNKQIPREFFTGFEGGGWTDPNDPRVYKPEEPTQQVPLGPGGPGILGTLAGGATQLVAHGAGLAANAIPSISSGQGTGPLPGPAPGTATGTTGGLTPLSVNLFGLDIPIGQVPEGPGWGPGGPPVGLGGGEDKFDIRKFGIGPGPAGSGPNDWAKFTGKWASDLLGGFGNTFINGVSGFLGIDIMGNPYSQAALKAAGHFFGTAPGDGSSDSSIQGPGAAESAAAASGLLDFAGGMPMNGPYDASAANPSGAGNGGLQTNTLRGKYIIQKLFPWATNIGGVRADNLKWHPQGLALDVMIPGAGGNNDPTPPQGKILGDQLYAWLMANQGQLGIDYILWQEKDHFNHLHVNFAASGYPPGQGPADVDSSTAGLTLPGAGLPGGAGAGLGASVFPGGGSTVGPGMGQDQFFAEYVAKLRAEGKPIPPAYQKYDKGYGGGPPGKTPPPLKAPGGVGSKGSLGRLYGLPGYRKGGLVKGVRSFAGGGYNAPQGAVIIPKPPFPPPGPGAQRKNVPAQPRPSVSPPPSIAAPSAPPVVSGGIPGSPAPSGVPTVEPTGPSNAPVQIGSGPGTTTPQMGTEQYMHLHPAIQKGIASTASVLGNVASIAASMGMMAAGAGASGGAGAAGGGMGSGLASSLVAGLFSQGGKIATNVANVGASFLVGSLTGGTTANAYGVTQRGAIPSGGSRIYDASTQIGSIQTTDLDGYYQIENRRQAQRAQIAMGSWGVR